MHDANGLFIPEPKRIELAPAAAIVTLDQVLSLKLPISFETANDETLFRIPEDWKLALERLWWEIVEDFTGGSSSAIGVSSDEAPHEADGDLLGGATGNVAADLQAADGHTGGTIGTSFGSNGVVVLSGGTVIRFNRITSAFAAGSGFVHVRAHRIQ